MTGTPGRDREHLLDLALTILESPTPDDPWLEVLRELVDALRIADREREQVQRLQPLLHAVDACVAGGTAQAAAPPADPGITPRERAVLRLLADGLTAAAIGRRLAISPRTVHHHLERLYRKLGAGDRLAAVLNGQALGLLPGGAPRAENVVSC